MKKEQKPIDYADVVALKFKVEQSPDNVFFNKYGYLYKIVYLNLTKSIYIDWAQDTRFCTMYRTDKDNNILAKMPIIDFEQLQETINFFTIK